MPVHKVMDRVAGDIPHKWDATDAAAVKAAEERFKELTGLGFTAATRLPDGTTQLTRTFDPTVDETVFFPRLQGG
jgi:hypothetical protein